MPLWNHDPHKPSEYELIRLKTATKGRSGGSTAEWAWHGGKRRNAESPTLFGTNTGVFAKAIDRNSGAIDKIQTWGNKKEGITQCDFAFLPALVRNPETIVKVDKEAKAKSDHLSSLLDRLEKVCEGKEGDHEAEWSITRINGDSHVVFFSSIPSVISRLIRRNRGAIREARVYKYSKGEFGVSLDLDAEAVRHPATLLKVG